MRIPQHGLILRACLVGVLGLIVASVLFWEYQRTAPVRGAVRSFTSLLAAVNRADVETVRELCSNRYRTTHRFDPAPDGGVVGFPRNIHRNYQTWDRNHQVWICPGNRVGPVYRMILEGDAWLFDGLEGYLAPDGRGGTALVKVDP